MRKVTSILMTVLSLATSALADVRWHINPDESVFLDDDTYGTRLVTPEEYQAAREIAERHYGEVNPNSFTKLGRGYSVTFDIPPRRILSPDELEAWAAENSTSWWAKDLLLITYRNVEKKAVAVSAQDPDRAQSELNMKRETAQIPVPPASMLRRLAAHGIQYSGKAYTTDGSRTWRFAIKDPNSAREIDFPVPAGTSEQAIIKEAYKATSGTGPFSGAWARQFLH
jgi:hypothetical protein